MAFRLLVSALAVEPLQKNLKDLVTKVVGKVFVVITISKIYSLYATYTPQLKYF